MGRPNSLHARLMLLPESFLRTAILRRLRRRQGLFVFSDSPNNFATNNRPNILIFIFLLVAIL